MEKTKKKITALPILIMIAVFLFVLILMLDKPETAQIEETEPVETASTEAPTEDPYAFAHTPLDRLMVYARLNDLKLSDWPD